MGIFRIVPTILTCIFFLFTPLCLADPLSTETASHIRLCNVKVKLQVFDEDEKLIKEMTIPDDLPEKVKSKIKIPPLKGSPALFQKIINRVAHEIGGNPQINAEIEAALQELGHSSGSYRVRAYCSEDNSIHHEVGPIEV